MKPEDRPVLNGSITRLQLARMGRWPCCGGWFPGVHREACSVPVTEILTPQEAIKLWGSHDANSDR